MFTGRHKQYKDFSCTQDLGELAVPEQPLRPSDIEMEEQIGCGTFGKVYNGRIKKLDVPVAVKKVQQDKKYKTREV